MIGLGQNLSTKPPSNNSSAIQFSNIAGTSVTISWTKGDGSTIVLIKQGSSVNSFPVDGNSYTANTVFGSGSQLGSGNYTIYSGVGTTVNITGLSPGKEYFVKVFSFDRTRYLIPVETNFSPVSFITPAIASDISNLKIWHDVSQWTGLNNGDLVGAFQDASGHSIFPGAAGASRGTYRTGGANGKPYLDIASGNLYSDVKANWDFLHKGNSTAIFVIDVSSVDTNSVLFASCTSSVAQVGRVCRFTAANKFEDVCYNADGVNPLFSSSTVVITPTGLQLIVLRYEQGKSGNDSEIEINNILKASSDSVGSPSASTAAANIVLFRASGGASSQLLCKFYESIYFDRALSDSELSSLVGSLTTTFG